MPASDKVACSWDGLVIDERIGGVNADTATVGFGQAGSENCTYDAFGRLTAPCLPVTYWSSALGGRVTTER